MKNSASDLTADAELLRKPSRRFRLSTLLYIVGRICGNGSTKCLSLTHYFRFVVEISMLIRTCIYIT